MAFARIPHGKILPKPVQCHTGLVPPPQDPSAALTASLSPLPTTRSLTPETTGLFSVSNCAMHVANVL